ncbi:MAG: magnesium transporter, partial [Terriglobia bacterium]
SIGGNTSFQASTVAVRALAIGELDPRTVGRRLFREARLGLTMSLLSAAVLFAAALLWHKLLALAIIVAVSNITIVVVGALTGTLAPIVLSRLGIDPAVSSSPFLALIMDAVSLLLYFLVALAVLNFYQMI